MMTDPERVEALLDMVDPARAAAPSRGPELAVLGLAVGKDSDRRKADVLDVSNGWTADMAVTSTVA